MNRENIRRLSEHIRMQEPAVDVKGSFLAFLNAKVAQHSIRHSLDGRALLYNRKPEYTSILDAMDIGAVFKFTVVRNPWDRVVSAFHYLQQLQKAVNKNGDILIGEEENFRDFIKTRLREHGPGINAHFRCQYSRAFFRGKQFVDFVARLETIAPDWHYIASVIGCSNVLPRKNTSVHFRCECYYDRECRDIVGNIYREDMEAFGYSFRYR